MQRNLLLPPERVSTSDYFKKWRPGFRLAGFIQVMPYTAPPPYNTWAKPPYNRFCAIAHEAFVDDTPAFVLPVFVNDALTNVVFDGDLNQDLAKPAIAFFKGNDDWHYALRFETFGERDSMIEFFGEDLGFLEKDLIGHN